MRWIVGAFFIAPSVFFLFFFFLFLSAYIGEKYQQGGSTQQQKFNFFFNVYISLTSVSLSIAYFSFFLLAFVVAAVGGGVLFVDVLCAPE